MTTHITLMLTPLPVRCLESQEKRCCSASFRISSSLAAMAKLKKRGKHLSRKVNSQETFAFIDPTEPRGNLNTGQRPGFFLIVICLYSATLLSGSKLKKSYAGLMTNWKNESRNARLNW